MGPWGVWVILSLGQVHLVQRFDLSKHLLLLSNHESCLEPVAKDCVSFLCKLC